LVAVRITVLAPDRRDRISAITVFPDPVGIDNPIKREGEWYQSKDRLTASLCPGYHPRYRSIPNKADGGGNAII